MTYFSDEIPASFAERNDIFEDVLPAILLELDLLDEGVNALVVALELGQESRDVLHSLVIVGAVGLDELLDEGSLDFRVLFLDASGGVDKLLGWQFLGNQLEFEYNFRRLVES